MSKMKATPAPWLLIEEQDGFHVNGETDGSYKNRNAEPIGFVQGEPLQPKRIAVANAHLIAAAPELFEACELALSFWYSDHPNDSVEGHSAHDKIKAALAKACGEQS